MPVSVVLVDDVPEIRRLVRTALRFRGGFEVVGETGDGAGAIRLVAELRPDILVLDLGLPDIAGREVLVRTRQASPQTRVVVFSGTDVPDADWIASRVEGYVLKDEQLDYLVDLLERVGRSSDRAVRLQLERDPRSVSSARRFVRSTVTAWQLEPLADDTVLVVSELVTNAIVHAVSAPTLSLTQAPGGLRVEVHDDGVGTPEPQPASSTGESGRGMHLIDAMTSAWGIQLADDGSKTVWAELKLRG
ncbi:MAG TPA: response regulator [Actinomycetales bacterium]